MHLYILWLKIFAYTTRGPKIFRSLPTELFVSTRMPTANQGLQDGFLAMDLVWSLLISNPDWHHNVARFFLGCVLVTELCGADRTRICYWCKICQPCRRYEPPE